MLNGRLTLFVKFENDLRVEQLDADDVNEKLPQLVIKSYERNLRIVE